MAMGYVGAADPLPSTANPRMDCLPALFHRAMIQRGVRDPELNFSRGISDIQLLVLLA
jgi:hypothetical protein